MTREYPPLTAYRVFLSDGTNYVTNMAAGVTLADAQNYFVGQVFEQADEKTMLKCLKVEEVTA